LQAWLLGEWGGGDVWVDPNVWGVGRLPLSHFVVARASDRLKLFGLCRLRADFVRADCTDALERYGQRARAWTGAGKPPWLVAFESLCLPRLERPLRFFGWLLVHGALRCGGAMVSWRRAEPGFAVADFEELCACGADGCLLGPRDADEPPPCETLSHVFVACPVVRPAAEWLRDLWGQIGDSSPPLDARVLVLGDRSVWDPGGGDDRWELWTHLRLHFCRAVWSLTARRSASGQAFSAASVVAMAAQAVERAIRRDWVRVGAQPADFDALPTWCRLSVQRVVLELDVFKDRWLVRGVLAHLEAGVLRVHVPRAGLGQQVPAGP
jgi:hypothetical protein